MTVKIITELEQGVASETQFAIRDDIFTLPFNPKHLGARERVQHLLYGSFLESMGGLLYPGEQS